MAFNPNLRQSRSLGHADEVTLTVISFNMRGFHQGLSVLQDLDSTLHPDVLLLQEHWLTPANLFNFDKHFTNYFSFGCSALSKQLETGMLRGRPYGGVITLIKNNLRKITQTVKCDDRFAIVRIGDILLVNVYFPCRGTADRLAACEDLLCEIDYWREQYNWCHCVIAGDFNCTISDNNTDPVAQRLNRIIDDWSFRPCDKLFPGRLPFTYVNSSLNQQSYIDYVLVSSDSIVSNFDILDPDVNFSDHLPLVVSLSCITHSVVDSQTQHGSNTSTQHFPRWDKSDLSAYYRYTGEKFGPILSTLNNMLHSNRYDNLCLDRIYDEIVTILTVGENQFVPRHRKNFYKYWWNEDLKLLKQAAIESNRLWKAARRPRSGPIFDRRQKDKSNYRRKLRESEQTSTLSYTNDLHEALLQKRGTAFWKCWKANFESVNKCTQVENSVDPDVITSKFAAHFAGTYCPNDARKANALYDRYVRQRAAYCGLPLSDEHKIDTELVSNIISRLHRGKAPDVAGLTAEHIIFSHPSVAVVLCKLFVMIMQRSYVPNGFRHSYIVPVPKLKDCRAKSLSCEDFRGIAISPIISKIFEYCILDRFQVFLVSRENQFGFKKGQGCRSAIYKVRKTVDNLIDRKATVNMCAIDISKAFDKVNHSALFMKLIKRRIPAELLDLLENWLSDSFACVKWDNSWSYIFKVYSGVRQGFVLSPFLFTVYVDDIGNGFDLYQYVYVIMYADDILLIAPSVTLLQKLLWICEQELDALDMKVNAKKSCCIRIGIRHDKDCVKLTTYDGHDLDWVNQVRYLGVFICSSTKFKCSVDYAKKAFYRAANGIFAKVGRLASEEVVLQLFMSKCLPILLYSLEVCALDRKTLQSLDFCFNRFFMKLFQTSSIEVVRECQDIFNCKLPSVILKDRYDRFLSMQSSTV